MIALLTCQIHKEFAKRPVIGIVNMHSSQDFRMFGISRRDTLHVDIDFKCDATPFHVVPSLWHPVNPIPTQNISATSPSRIKNEVKNSPTLIIPQFHRSPRDWNVENHILIPCDINCNFRVSNRRINDATYVLDGEGVQL
jgi:hypothetical protein